MTLLIIVTIGFVVGGGYALHRLYVSNSRPKWMDEFMKYFK